MIINDCKSNTRGIVIHMWAYYPSTHLQMYCWMYYSMQWQMSLSIMHNDARDTGWELEGSMLYSLGTGGEHVMSWFSLETGGEHVMSWYSNDCKSNTRGIVLHMWVSIADRGRNLAGAGAGIGWIWPGPGIFVFIFSWPGLGRDWKLAKYLGRDLAGIETIKISRPGFDRDWNYQNIPAGFWPGYILCYFIVLNPNSQSYKSVNLKIICYFIL